MSTEACTLERHQAPLLPASREQGSSDYLKLNQKHLKSVSDQIWLRATGAMQEAAYEVIVT